MKLINAKVLILSLIILFVSESCVQPKETVSKDLWSVKMADSEMVRFPELWMIENAKQPRWTYTFGLVAKSMMELSDHVGNTKYYDYAKNYADSLIDASGIVKTYKKDSYNIDNVSPGKILFELYYKTGDERYKIALDTLRNQMLEHPRTSEGGFWHKKIYPHQMWLDGLFMASPFLAEYGKRFNEPALYDEVVNQLKLVAKYTYDENTGLYYHGWDESREQRWANKETGTSPNFWARSFSRCVGYFA